MRPLILIALSAMSAVPEYASDRTSGSNIANLVGDWTGTSLCQVKPSACHDEQVVFRFSHPQSSKITVQADKIVEGKPITMGVGDWTYDSTTRSLTWQIPRGTWKLIVDGNAMDGTLIVQENVIFRRIHLTKSK